MHERVREILYMEHKKCHTKQRERERERDVERDVERDAAAVVVVEQAAVVSDFVRVFH